MSDRCPTCKRQYKRSNPANARYWLLLHVISEKVMPEGKCYSAESFHTYFKSRFLGMTEVKMPNGKVIQIPRSSSDLDKSEFAEFMMAVETWALERDVYLEDNREYIS